MEYCAYALPIRILALQATQGPGRPRLSRARLLTHRQVLGRSRRADDGAGAKAGEATLSKNGVITVLTVPYQS